MCALCPSAKDEWKKLDYVEHCVLLGMKLDSTSQRQDSVKNHALHYLCMSSLKLKWTVTMMVTMRVPLESEVEDMADPRRSSRTRHTPDYYFKGATVAISDMKEPTCVY